MMKTQIVLLAVLVATVAVVVSAQEQPRQSNDRSSSAQQNRILRLQQMEQALEDAVVRGVRVVEQQLPPMLPGMVLFAGPVQARGFVIDDYGVFFDVEYPAVRRSLLWSMDMLALMEGGMAATLEDLRRQLDAMPQGPGQLEFRRALAALEAEVQTVSQPGVPDANGGASGAEPPARFDPDAAFLSALRTELVGVLILFGKSTGISDDEWVSIAARDARGRVDPRVPGARRTLVLKVQGRDLAAIEAGRLSAEDVEALVELR